MSGTWMCWIANASQPFSLALLRWSTSRSNARPAVRTRSTGCISPSIVRIGLIFSVAPIHARAPPMRPPRRRYSSVSTITSSFQVLALPARGGQRARQVGPLRHGVGRRHGHEAVPASR